MSSARARRESQEVRAATLVLLRASDRLLSMAQRANERAITQLRVRVRGWQLALDPETRAWIGETKEALASGALDADAVDREEAVRRRDEARRGLSA